MNFETFQAAAIDFFSIDIFWLGVFPGLTKEMINYVVESINEFVENKIK